MTEVLRIATRKSALAMAQAEWVAAALQRLRPAWCVEIVQITSQGDRVLDTPLHLMGGKGVFTREIDAAVLENRADCAVHSLKDLPTEAVPGLTLAAVPERESVNDMLAGSKASCLDEIPKGATIATGSLRRRAQLLRLRPDLQIVDIRGNVNTRLKKLADAGWAGTVLAEAGLLRLGLRAVPRFSLAGQLLPAPGQGALGLVTRDGDAKTLELVGELQDHGARARVTAERAFLAAVEAGCHAPVGTLTTLKGDALHLVGAVFSIDGQEEVRMEATAEVSAAESLGQDVAARVLGSGGKAILDSLSNESGDSA